MAGGALERPTDYNLRAAVVIRRGHRDGLERLCRYVLRPPLARTRPATLDVLASLERSAKRRTRALRMTS